MRTTVELREDLYHRIVRENGKRQISNTINAALSEHFSKSSKSMFGSDPWLKDANMSDLRDKHDRDV